MTTGSVIRVLPNQGYAFVRSEDGMTHFAHASDFEKRWDFDKLHEGHCLEFNTEMTERGSRATHIRLLKFDDMEDV